MFIRAPPLVLSLVGFEVSLPLPVLAELLLHLGNEQSRMIDNQVCSKLFLL